MKDTYEIYQFRYKTKGGLKACIYARDEKTANEIISEYNKKNNELKFIKVKFFFKKKVYVTKPPYEIEQAQLDCVINGYRKSNR